jgi:hypothetical protein
MNRYFLIVVFVLACLCFMVSKSYAWDDYGPVAIISSPPDPTWLRPGQTICIDGSDSYSRMGLMTSWHLYFGDGYEAGYEGPPPYCPNAYVEHAYSSTDLYNPILWVYNYYGSDADSITIWVVDNDVYADSYIFCMNDLVAIHLSVDTPRCNDKVRLVMDPGIKVWSNALKQNEITNGTTWPACNYPATLYVEGITPGNARLWFQYLGYYFGAETPVPPQPEIQFTVAAPTNFRQTSATIHHPSGVLEFTYAWDSTSGNLADLSGCMVGEKVDYPGGNPYIWPSPPWSTSTLNPTIIDLSATLGGFQDTHGTGSFIKPYQAASFSASQIYRYKSCTGDYTTLMGPISIDRSVFWVGPPDSTWRYQIQKSGVTTWEDLP